MKSNYYSTRETSQKLGINISKVMRMIKDKKLKAQKVGWVWIVSKDQVDQLVAEAKEIQAS